MLLSFSHQVLSNSSQPRGLQHSRPPCPLTISRSLPKFMSIALVMASNHLILCHPLFLLHSISPSIRIFSNELALCFRCPKYWSFSFSSSPYSEYLGRFPLRLTGLISLVSKGLSRVFFSTTVQKHQFFGMLPYLWASSHNHM